MRALVITRELNEMQKLGCEVPKRSVFSVPFGVTYEKIGTIQRRLAWPLHKDDTLSRSGRPTGLNIYALFAHELTCRLYTTAVDARVGDLCFHPS